MVCLGACVLPVCLAFVAAVPVEYCRRGGETCACVCVLLSRGEGENEGKAWARDSSAPSQARRGSILRPRLACPLCWFISLFDRCVDWRDLIREDPPVWPILGFHAIYRPLLPSFVPLALTRGPFCFLFFWLPVLYLKIYVCLCVCVFISVCWLSSLLPFLGPRPHTTYTHVSLSIIRPAPRATMTDTLIWDPCWN